jgi:poly(beta-D-mannuronate) lyase
MASASRNVRLVATFMLAVLASPFGYSTQYRVSTAAGIASRMLTAQPGDTLTMTNGTWINQSIMFAGFGTAAAPIILRAESYGGVVLTGTSTLNISGRNLVADGLLFRNGYSTAGNAVISFQGAVVSDSCRVTNCSIEEYNPTDLTTDYKWVSLYGSHNRVDHCFFRGKTHQGTMLVVWCNITKSDFHLIDHNHFAFRPALPGNANGGETIRIGTGAVSTTNSYTVVEYNYFEKCNGDAEYISNKTNANTIRFNTFVSCEGTLSIRQGNSCIIQGNFILGKHTPSTTRSVGGLRLTGADHKVFNNYISGVDDNKAGCAFVLLNGTLSTVTPNYPQVKRAIVAFNTIVDNKYAFGLGVTSTGGAFQPDSCTFANNVALSSTSTPVISAGGSDYAGTTNTTWTGNIFYNASGGIGSTDTGITNTNPQLSVASDGLYRPGSSSPVINAARSPGLFPYVTDDMDGQLRLDGSPDVGADEVSTAAITRRPLTPADVGPPPGMITAVTSREEDALTVPSEFRLEQNYPDPFNPETAIRYQLATESLVRIAVYDVLGRQVASLINGEKSAGFYSVSWNASGLSSGIYFCQFVAGREYKVMKMILAK